MTNPAADTFFYRLAYLSDSEEDPETEIETGFTTSTESTFAGRIELHFEAGEEDLLTEALNAVGVRNAEDFSIEPTEEGDFLIRDEFGEPFLAVDLEAETVEEPADASEFYAEFDR